MKRSLNKNEIEPKRIKTQDTPLLHDDLVYEVGTCLSPSFLLSSCVLVCKQWKRVIEARFEFEFELDEFQTGQFISKNECVTAKITRLSLTMIWKAWIYQYCTDGRLFGQWNTHKYSLLSGGAEALSNSLKGMKHLKHLSLHGSQLSGDSLQKILDTTELDSLSIENCLLKWHDLEAFVSSNCNLSISLNYHEWCYAGSVQECVDVMQRIPHLVAVCRMGSIPGSDGLLSECLSNSTSLRKLSIELTNFTIKYIPLMRNLTDLRLSWSRDDRPIDGLVDLRRLVHLLSLIHI